MQPRFGNWPVASITAAEVSSWVGSLMARGLAPSTATRALATLRSILAFAVADGRVQHNVAAAARNPTSGQARREGQALTLVEVHSLTETCKGRYRDVVPVMALAGLRWGELAGLRVGDRIWAPGSGLRLQRAVLASGGGPLYVDTLKNKRARTVPLVDELVSIVDRWSAGKAPDARHRDGDHHQDQAGKTAGLLPDSRAAVMSRPFGRKPYGRATAARSSCPASAGRRSPP